MAKTRKLLPLIRRAKRLRRKPALAKFDVTRGEYNRIIDILNDRAVVLNEFRDAINDLQRASDVQFKRIAQMQADFDVVKRAWEKIGLLP